MKYMFWVLTLLTTSLHALIEVDVDYLQKQINQNPNNIPYRLILTKYYIQEGQYNIAQRYLTEIHKLDPKNSTANQLQSKLSQMKNLQTILPDTTLTNPFSLEKTLHPLAAQKKCKQFLKIYHTVDQLSLILTDQTKLDAALCYIHNNNPKQAHLLLKVHEFPISDQLLAVKTLLALSKDNLPEANKYYLQLEKTYPKSPYLITTQRAIYKYKEQQTQAIARDAFTNNSLKALQDYIYLLNKENKKEEAIQAVQNFVQKYPKNKDAKILLAKLYYYNGNLKKAFHTLYPVRRYSRETEKLYANILYEKGDYTHALYYLPKLAKREKDPKQRYTLQKRAAFAYAYTGSKDKATKLFDKLLEHNPKDIEILRFKNEYQSQLTLQKAIQAYRNRDFDTALKYYLTYYAKNKDPKVAKEIAEIYYYKEKFGKTLPYFQHYLNNFPSDTLIRFHYATALEKEKDYKNSAPQFAQVAQNTQGKIHYLAKYHEAYSLMGQQEDTPWIQARNILKALHLELTSTDPQQYTNLKKFTSAQLKRAMGPVQKPTYYKDIVLTEGAKKVLDTAAVFADVNFLSTTKPSLKTLLHIETDRQKIKPQIILSMDYANDTQTQYKNYQAKVANLMAINGIRYSAIAKQYRFDFKNSNSQSGQGFFLQAGTKNLTFGLGVEQFDTFNTLVPTLTWSPVYGAHTLYMELSYRNGIFTNYRRCMLDNKTEVLHFGLYDKILMENLNYTELGLSVNAYEDGNTNIYAMLDVPVYSTTAWGIEHSIHINENIDYNTKTDVCYKPSRLYDSTYIKYRPKIEFEDGSLTISLGSGYSFQNSEQINSYAVHGNYTFKNLATFEINCEQLQSSFTTEDIQYCTFNIIQGW